MEVQYLFYGLILTPFLFIGFPLTQAAGWENIARKEERIKLKRELYALCVHLRINISDRRDSTPLRLTKIWLTQPLPTCSVRRAGSAVY